MLVWIARLLAVPVLALTAGAVWSHMSGTDPSAGSPAHSARAPGHTRAPRDGSGAAAVAAPSASPSAVSAGGVSAERVGELTAGLWQRINDDMRGTATGQQAIVHDLSAAIRRQLEQLLRHYAPNG